MFIAKHWTYKKLLNIEYYSVVSEIICKWRHCRLQWREGNVQEFLTQKSYIIITLGLCVFVCVCVLVTQSYLTLCNPMDCSPPGSSVHRILQARILEWVSISSSRGSSWPRKWTWVSHLAGIFFVAWATWETHYIVAQCQNINCSLDV